MWWGRGRRLLRFLRLMVRGLGGERGMWRIRIFLTCVLLAIYLLILSLSAP